MGFDGAGDTGKNVFNFGVYWPALSSHKGQN